MLRKSLLALITSVLAFGSLAVAASANARSPYHYYQAPSFQGPIEVHWGNSWYAAELLDVRGDAYLIRYSGWSSSFDEWVGADRIRKAPSAYNPRVQIYWGNGWYPGRIVKQDGYRYLVTYDGWSSTFDEWVDDSRLRFETPVYAPTYRPAPAYRPVPSTPVRHVKPYKRAFRRHR